MIRNISTIHGISCLQCVWNRIGSALRDLRVIKITTPKSHLPQVGSVWQHVPLRLLKSPQSCPVMFVPSTTHFWVINQSEMMQYLNQTLWMLKEELFLLLSVVTHLNGRVLLQRLLLPVH